MRVEIFIVSYAKDLPWLNYCLESIRKFAHGFALTTVLVPEQEEQQFHGLGGHGVIFRSYLREEDPKLWHIQHQCEKMHADIWCHGADLILHTDSDCIFTEFVRPDDYLSAGLPVLLMEPYARLPQDHWKPTVDRALGINADCETMRRHPAVHWRGLYADCRKRIEEIHKKSCDAYVLSVKPDFPWGISEFNVLGGFARWSPQWNPRYHWIDVSQQPHPPSSKKLIQFWSHSPPDKPQSTPWGVQCTPAEVVNQKLYAS